ncbi:hypothetical protein EYF80_029870 [Liparis tanakae]|uniref:Uncharacterized protein n=1 Tax=Liparis tanakae TaxID=230148 RepID=A0A4Z2H504_9TELE|nr:hypothetical protein EYF80_029870 [Liparis tanakae]
MAELTLANTTVPSGTERSVTPEQSRPRRNWKKAGSVTGGRTERRNSTSGATKTLDLIQKRGPKLSACSQKRNERRNSRQSCSPANSEKPPPNGSSLKKSSNAAGSWCRPARQYAYAMVNW